MSEQISPRQFGSWAREAGRGIDSCPLYGITQEAAEQRKEWQRGWEQENERRSPKPQPKLKRNPIRKRR